MTRAKDHLHLLLPHRFYVQSQRGNGDRHMYAARTRFIPSDILRLFESFAWPPAAAAETATARQASQDPVDIGARLRRMWR